MVVLTENFLLMKTRMQSLAHIRRLNAWGQDLDDVSLLNQLDNVEVISLSVNHISTLEPFHGLPHLQELHLRKNCVRDLAELDHLRHCPQLRVLTLCENPVAHASIYRELVIALLPNLEKLDDKEVTEEEARRACSVVAQRQEQCGGDWGRLFVEEDMRMERSMAENEQQAEEQRRQEEEYQRELLREQRRKSHAGVSDQSPGEYFVSRARSAGDLSAEEKPPARGQRSSPGTTAAASPVPSQPRARGAFDLSGAPSVARRTPPRAQPPAMPSPSPGAPPASASAVQNPEILNSVLNLLSCLDMESLEIVKCRAETHIARHQQQQPAPRQMMAPAGEAAPSQPARMQRQDSNPHMEREDRPAVSRAQMQLVEAGVYDSASPQDPAQQQQQRRRDPARPVMCL